MKAISYQIEPEVCADMRSRIKDMPAVHEILSDYHKTLRVAYVTIEDSEMDNDWRDKQFKDIKAKAKDLMIHELRWYPWVTQSFLDKAYHE